MPDPLLDALRPLLGRLALHLSAHPELRAELAAATQAAAAWLGGPPAPVLDATPAAVEPPVPQPQPEPAPVEAPAASPPDRPAVVPIPANFHIPIRSTAVETQPSAVSLPANVYLPHAGPLADLAARCKQKAEAARRRAAGAADTASEPAWSFDPADVRPAAWRHLAGAFDAAAAAADLLGAWRALPPDDQAARQSEVLHAAAEGQAVLYAAADAAGSPRPDPDQIDLFKFIRDETAVRRVYVERYLTREDRADPAAGADIAGRLTGLAARLTRSRTADKERERLFKNLARKVKLFAADPAAAADDWPRIVGIIDELVGDYGVPPSSVDLRERLLPLAHSVPDELLTPHAARAFREIDAYLEQQAEATAAAGDAGPPAFNADVAVVRRYLEGRAGVFIGGQVRPARKAALEEAFGLTELNWITSPEHTSTAVFEAPVARPEVAVVILATRWSNHDYQNVKDFCVKHGKLFVKLPAGYHPNMVAHVLLAQAGDKLRGPA